MRQKRREYSLLILHHHHLSYYFCLQYVSFHSSRAMSGIQKTVFSSLLPHLFLYSSLRFYLIFSSILFFSPTSSSPLFFSSFLPYLLLYISLLFSFISSSPLPNLLLFSFILLTLILPSLFDNSTPFGFPVVPENVNDERRVE